MPEIDLQCCILGAGVVGLTTALKLQKLFGNNVNYTLVAELFNEETTSHVAAGLFRPSTSFLVCNDMDITKKCIRDSYNYYLDYLNKDCGISEISGYMFSSLDASLVRNHYLEGLVPVYRQVTEEELNMCPGGWKYGSFSASLLIECRNYLPWAISQFKENGGKIVKMKVDSLSDLRKIGKFDLLMNCSGLGAKKLFNDGKVIPIRGQVFKVQAPWLNHFYYGEGDTYIIPSAGGATLGGTRQFGSWNTSVCKHDAASIWERCTNLVPKLADSSNKILKEMVGLRPHRDSGVRIDVDIMDGLKIVHNYGHGGYGVTSAPGTADLAVKLAEQLVKFSTSKL